MTTDIQNIPPSPERDSLEYLMALINAMRTHQKAYFTRKSDVDKRYAIKAEKEVDSAMLRLKSRGYSGDRYIDKVKQLKLL